MSSKERVFCSLDLHATKSMESLLIALIVATLIIALIFSRLAPALLFTVAMAACVLVGAIDMKAVMGKATNEGLVTLLLLLMVCAGNCCMLV